MKSFRAHYYVGDVTEDVIAEDRDAVAKMLRARRAESIKIEEGDQLHEVVDWCEACGGPIWYGENDYVIACEESISLHRRCFDDEEGAA